LTVYEKDFSETDVAKESSSMGARGCFSSNLNLSQKSITSFVQ
jgi:hypothetical protein